jgi:Arc/MetJ family transcription regulator
MRRQKMATNLAINDNLINEAVAVGHHRTKKEAVTIALQEYIQRHKQQEIVGLFGKINYTSDYHYKKNRDK